MVSPVGFVDSLSMAASACCCDKVSGVLRKLLCGGSRHVGVFVIVIVAVIVIVICVCCCSEVFRHSDVSANTAKAIVAELVVRHLVVATKSPPAVL